MVSCSILWWLIFKQINMFKREKGKMKNPRTQTELLTVSVPLFDSAAINWLSSPHSSITLSLFLFLIIVRLNYLDIQMLYFISFCIHDTIMGYHRFFPHCHCCTAVRISALVPLLLGQSFSYDLVQDPRLPCFHTLGVLGSSSWPAFL